MRLLKGMLLLLFVFVVIALLLPVTALGFVWAMLYAAFVSGFSYAEDFVRYLKRVLLGGY